MLSIDDKEFDRLISEAMDELPQKYIKGLQNVVVVYEDEPTREQLTELNVRYGHTLFGLYQGVPRTHRGAGYNMVLPDKITIFKQPMLRASSTMEELKRQVKHTLWHEIAHYYGLDHGRIHELERKTLS